MVMMVVMMIATKIVVKLLLYMNVRCHQLAVMIGRRFVFVSATVFLLVSVKHRCPVTGPPIYLHMRISCFEQNHTCKYLEHAHGRMMVEIHSFSLKPKPQSARGRVVADLRERPIA